MPRLCKTDAEFATPVSWNGTSASDPRRRQCTPSNDQGNKALSRPAAGADPMSTRGQRNRRPGGRRAASCLLGVVFCLGMGGGPRASAQAPDSSELKTQDLQPTFKVRAERNLVIVRVVVRDSKGQVVRNLEKQDFRLFDNRKPQVISQFALEEPARRATAGPGTQSGNDEEEARPESRLDSVIPQRYLGIYWDDVHMPFEEISLSRDAADRYLTAALQPGDRVGIFTSSGQTALDFTESGEKLREALSKLRPTPIIGKEIDPCPDLPAYEAYKIVHERDPVAIDAATREVLACRYQDQAPMIQQAQNDAEAAAMQTLTRAERESEYALRGVEEVIRRLTTLPGQRNVILVSPGFLTESMRQRVSEITDRAIRANVMINAIDSRGLYAIVPGGGVSERGPRFISAHADLVGKKEMFRINQLQRDTEGIQIMALDTGGSFFHNSNDLADGFRKAMAFPEAYYVLAFSPERLKLDGSFHSLKVQLVSRPGLSVQARTGYFAPSKPVDPAAQAKEEIEQAIFSQDELRGLPVDVHTQFFRVNNSDARLAVLTHLDLQAISFRKEGDRNLDELTFVTAVFDRDGKYISGREKRLELRLRDTSLATLLRSGMTVRMMFDVPPGNYLVRQVVREAEGGLLSGLNRSVEIPY